MRKAARGNTAGLDLRVRVYVETASGRARGIGWPLARLALSDAQLAVRSRVPA